MANSKIHTVGGDGRVCVRWRNTGTDGLQTLQRAYDAAFTLGLVTLSSSIAQGTQTYDDVLTNDQSTFYYYRVSDAGGTNSTADEAFAHNAIFLASDNFYRIPLGAGKKVLFLTDAAATPAGSDTNTGLNPGVPLLSWAGVSNASFGNWQPGDFVLCERGRTIVQKIADYHPNTVTFTTYSVWGAYGQRSVARPICDGSVAAGTTPFNFQATGGTTNVALFAVEHIDFSCNVGVRAATDPPGINIVSESGLGGSTGGGTFYLQGNRVKQWQFGAQEIVVNQTGRWKNCVVHRNVAERNWTHGTGSNPSGMLFSSVDGLTLYQNVLNHNGFDETSPAMVSNGFSASGTMTGVPTATGFSDSTKTWTVNAFVGRMVWVQGATFGRVIQSNTANSITLAASDAFNQLGDSTPSTGFTYTVPEGGTPSQFRHNWYIQDDCTAVLAYGNAATGADLMCRSAGQFYRNYIAKSSIGFTVGGYNTTGVGSLAIDVQDSMVDGASPLDIIQYSGGMIGYLGTAGQACASISVNGLLANGHPLEGLDFYAGGLDVLGTCSGSVSLTNSVLIWKNRGIQFPSPMTLAGLTTSGLQIWVTTRLNQQNCIGSSGTWNGGTQSNGGNSYFSVDSNGSTSGVFYASGDQSFAQMKTAMNDTTSTYLSSAPTYTERRGGDYAGTVGLGSNIAALFTAMSANRFGSWDTRYMAEPCISYCRQGYGMSALPNLPVDVPLTNGSPGGGRRQSTLKYGRGFGVQGRGEV